MTTTKTLCAIGALACVIGPTLAAQDGPASQPSSRATSRPSTQTSWTGVLDEDSFAALHELQKGDAPKLHGTDVEIADGTAGYLALPSAPRRPQGGIVVIHEWWGLNDHVKHWADRLAASGYAALAVDLYGGTVATTREDAMAAMKAVDPEAALASLRAAHAMLRDDPRVTAEKTASIGWCFGGGWSLRLAMAEPELDASVIYYGRLVSDPKELAGIKAPVLGIFGTQDRGIPPEAVAAFADAMETAGKSLELHSYDAEHAFANPSGAHYDNENASAAWREVQEFLREHLGPAKIGMLSDRSHPLEYDVPEGWRKSEGSSMRLLSFAAGESCDVSVIALPGAAGGLNANLNRWRQQMGADDLTAAEIEALPSVQMLDGKATRMRVAGSYTAMSGESIAEAVLQGAVLRRDGELVFVKMVGPAAEMKGEGARFDAFCRSLR